MSSCSPKVSIFVITYNQVNLVREAILSCVNQDYDNFEVVISDDGSTDGTVDVLVDLKKAYPDKINLILNPINQGIAKNSNIALSNCRGEFVAFMGGDDILYPEKIRIQVAAFQANENLVFCYHPCHVMYEGAVVETVGDRKKDLVRDFHDVISNYGAQISGPVPMMAMHAKPSRGFDESIPTACDWLLFIEVCARGDVVRLDNVLSIYRKHSNNIGKRIFEYGDDFLKTLAQVEIKFGSDPKVAKACNKGRKRFLLGIIYNAIAVGNDAAFKKYFDIYSAAHGRLAGLIVIARYFPFLKSVFRAARGFLKKYV